MDRSQQYISTLLERVPRTELADPEHATTFERIRERLSGGQDLQAQLKELYRVASFSDFALGLMWIAEKVESDTSKLESSSEEENFVLGLLKRAFGEVSQGEGMSPVSPSEQPVGFDFAPQPSSEPTLSTEPMQAGSSDDGASATAGFGEVSSAPSSEGVTLSEQNFVSNLEKLLESVQSGSEERVKYLNEVSKIAEGIVAGEGFEQDCKTYCSHLIEFLAYISTNQIYDDIRVMNLISNVYDPFSQWVKTDPASRMGTLEQSIEMLRDFKTLFE
jgi:hypothetical protein